jgi:regulator of sigma D
MTLKEARKLAAHGIGTMALLAHKNKYFDEVVAALESVLNMDDAEWLGETHKGTVLEAEATLARAKEVEI